jgi:hypothetical protein
MIFKHKFRSISPQTSLGQDEDRQASWPFCWTRDLATMDLYNLGQGIRWARAPS